MNAPRFRGVALCLVAFAGLVLAQPPGGPGGFGGGFGGPPGSGTRKILKDFDKNGDGWLNAEERKEARAAMKKDGGDRRGGPRGGGFGPHVEPGKPGPHIEPSEVANYPDKPLYDPSILRTFFLQFENADWEAELQEFHGTDVEVPCTATIDGKSYKNVGVHFRGMSSYMMVPAGSKRSLNLHFALVDSKQKLYGSKTLNLLNNHEDDSMLSTILYSHVARQYTPTPKANMVRVVINGEYWGVYTNVQQFDKEFLKENYKSDAGTRWKIRGSPGGRGGLEYFGDDVESYKRIFEIKTKDDPKAWKALIAFCKVLKETPPDKLEAALKPICDIDNLLWFLALDVALINNDGYWTRASDYSLYLDAKGKFHFIPHDMNEAFTNVQGGPGGGGFGGGMRFAMPTPGEILPAALRTMLRLTDEQKKQMDTLQKETDEKMAAILNDDQKKQLKEMKDRSQAPMGGGGFGGGPPGGGGGPGGGMGGGAGGGVKLDPLVGLNNERMPLRSKVLAVPALKEKYLADVRTIAEKSLDWKNLGPVVAQYRAILSKEVEKDTRKLSSYDNFMKITADVVGETRGREIPLRAFADQRRAYLLEVTSKK